MHEHGRRLMIAISSVLLVCAVVSAQAAAAPAPRLTVQSKLVIQPPTPQLAAKLQRFRGRYGSKVKVLWDQRTRLPANIANMDLKVAPVLSVGSIDRSVHRFVADNRDFLGVRMASLARRSSIMRRGRVLVQYQQMHEGIPVERAGVGCVGSVDGKLLRYRSSCMSPDVDIRTDARVRMAQAEGIARGALGPAGQAALLTKLQKVIRREATPARTNYRLIYKAFFTTNDRNRNPHQFVEMDANTGAVIASGDATPYNITGTVRGQIWPEKPADALVLRGIENLTITGIPIFVFPFFFTPQTTVSGTNGNYSLPVPMGSWVLFAGLAGPYAGVSNSSGPEVSHVSNVNSPKAHSWDWTGNNAAREQVNVFYHINKLHDELYQDMLGYAWTNSWTGDSQFLAETGYTFNNAYAGSPMTFGTANYVRDAAIIYHECDHNVLYTLFGGDWIGYPDANSEAYAFDEGFADFFSGVMLNTSTVCGRNLDNNIDYSSNYNINTGQGLEGHSGGRIIGGAAWDLRGLMQEKLGANAGASANANLVFDSLATMATYPSPYRFCDPGTSNFLDALLETDDTNNNLSDGTPNDREIFQAFRNHGMLAVDVFARDHSADTGDVPSDPSGEVFWLSPDIDLVDSTTIKVRVRNIGYRNAASVKVDAYYHNLFAGGAWPTGWHKFGSATVTNIGAGSNKWSANIQRTSGSLTGHAIMARLVTDDDPMTEPASVNLENNVVKRNKTIILVMANQFVVAPYLVKAHLYVLAKAYPTSPPSAPASKRARAQEPKPAKAKAVTIDIIRENIPPDVRLNLELVNAKDKRPLPRPPRPGRRVLRMAPTEQRPTDAPDKAVSRRVKKAFEDLDVAVGKRVPKARPDRPGPAAKVRAHRKPSVGLRECRVDSYRNVPVRPDSAALMKAAFRVPRNAKPGDSYFLHIAEKIDGKVVDGLTYEFQVKRR